MKERLKVFLSLYAEFFYIGLFTIGGGLAMMPLMRDRLITKRKWMSEEELLDYYAIGQSTPGIIAINVSTFIGYKQARLLGALVSTLAMVTPSLIIIILLSNFISGINKNPLIQKALRGVNVGIAALLTDVTVNFARKTVKNYFTAFIFIITFILVALLRVPSFLIIFSAILFGIFLSFIKK